MRILRPAVDFVPARPHPIGSAEHVLRLQRRVGNTAVRALLQRATREADELAARSVASSALGRRTIRVGSTGSDVAFAQQRLNLHGALPPLAEDALFGPLTRAATIEYQKSHGLVPDAVVGSRTWESLEGPANPGGSSNAGGSGGAGGPGSKVMEYDTGGQRFAPPAPGTKMSDIRDAIKAKQDRKPEPALGPTVSAIGVTQGGDEEVFVWNVLLQRGERKFWGGEVDVVAAIGPAPKGGGPPPVGEVTIRIDGQGNASAELIQRGAVAKSAGFADADAAKAALLKDFGFSAVRDGTGSWQLVELNKAHAALSRLPSGDRSALQGIDLIRDTTLTDPDGNPLSGRFDHQASIATGATTATRSESLHLADSAFANDDIAFIGGKGNAAVESFEVIVHEAGHAVEGKAQRDAQFAKMQAQGKLNETNAKVNDAVAAFNPEMQSAVGKLNRYPGVQRKTAIPFNATINRATTAIDAYGRGDNADRHAALEASAQRAITARDAAKAKLPSLHPAIADFAKTCSLQDAWFTAAQARAPVHTAFAQARTSEAAAGDPAHAGRSRHLKDFVDFVTAKKIPPLTEYAKANWPSKPEEFFAEAYSLWLNDPDYLTANAHGLKDWFDAGEHRK